MNSHMRRHKSGQMQNGQRHAGAGTVFQPLEQRRLLAGNVTVTFSDVPGVITSMIGDNNANQIRVVDGALIEGLNGTTINGQSSPVAGLFENVVIDLGNGDDSIEFFTPSGAVGFNSETMRLNTGNGDDRVTFDRVSFAEDNIVDTGNGNDIVTLLHWGEAFAEFPEFIHPITILTGNGDDQVHIENSHFNDLNIDTGNGKDAISLSGTVAVTGSAILDGGNGQDLLTGLGSLAAGSQSVRNIEVVS